MFRVLALLQFEPLHNSKGEPLMVLGAAGTLDQYVSRYLCRERRRTRFLNKVGFELLGREFQHRRHSPLLQAPELLV